jgi:hypothetical protein
MGSVGRAKSLLDASLGAHGGTGSHQNDDTSIARASSPLDVFHKRSFRPSAPWLCRWFQVEDYALLRDECVLWAQSLEPESDPSDEENVDM